MNSDKKNILVVEDDQFFRKTLIKFITASSLSCSILEASGSRQAIEVLNDQRVDLIITDLEMPEMDGFSLINTIQNNCSRQIPIIVVSGLEEYIEKFSIADMVGVEHFIRKDMIFYNLIPVLNRYL